MSTTGRWVATAGLAGLSLLPASAHAQGQVEPASLMTTPVYLFSGTRQVSQGTGFLYGNQNAKEEFEAVFLVTNYHVVTGHSPGTNAAPSGDRVVFYLHLDQNDPASVRQVQLPLYSPTGAPLWDQSEQHPQADVILLPIPETVWREILMFVFVEAHTRGDIKIRPTSGATLLGYPFGFSDTANRLPVWKTGHVASEPEVDFRGQPAFLVDVSAFPGMSGSPVLAVANGLYEDANGVMRTGRVLRLLGIFAAMPVVRADANSTNDTSLQLGYVWKAALIADLARAYHRK